LTILTAEIDATNFGMKPFANANFQNNLEDSANKKQVIIQKPKSRFRKKSTKYITFILFTFLKPKLGVKY